MKLEKINYNSAVVFGVLSLIMYLAIGVLQWSSWDSLVSAGVAFGAFSPWMVFVVAPVIGGISGYLFVLVGIVVYNLVAREYPISWTIKK